MVTEDGSVEFDDGYKQGSTVVFDMTDMMLRRRGEDSSPPSFPKTCPESTFHEALSDDASSLVAALEFPVERRAKLFLGVAEDRGPMAGQPVFELETEGRADVARGGVDLLAIMREIILWSASE